jgi:membrane protein
MEDGSPVAPFNGCNIAEGRMILLESDMLNLPPARALKTAMAPATESDATAKPGFRVRDQLAVFGITYSAWVRERHTLLAAALAYYGFFSLAPLIFIAFAVAGFFVDTAGISAQLFLILETLLGQEASRFVQEMVGAVPTPSQGESALAISVSVAAVLWAASGLFVNLQNALNTIWGVEMPTRGTSFVVIRQRLLGFVLVLLAGLALVILASASLVVSWLGEWLPSTAAYGGLGPLSFALLAAMVLLLVYRFMPQTRVAWRDVWLGAVLTASLITLAGVLVSLFLRSGILNSPLGAAGAYVVVLSAMYYTAFMFLLGAVFTREYANRHGSRRLAHH